MDRWLENEVDRGTRRIEAVLKSQMDELNEKRMSKLQVFKEILRGMKRLVMVCRFTSKGMKRLRRNARL